MRQHDGGRERTRRLQGFWLDCEVSFEPALLCDWRFVRCVSTRLPKTWRHCDVAIPIQRE